jgi:hypothetical protein
METFVRHPFDEFRADRWRIAWLAFVVAVLVHLILILVLPEKLMPAHRTAGEDEVVVYDISLVEEQELRFVEANPDAPENEPDRKDQYSFRAQQAADDNPLADASNRPTVEGEEDSQKILQGQLEQTPPIPPGVYSPSAKPGEGEGTEGGKPGAQAQPQVAAAEPLPAPDFIRQDPVAEEGPGSRSTLVADAPEVVPDPVPDAPINVYRPPDQARPQPEAEAGDGSGGAVDARPMPRARPRLAPELITGPLLKSTGSASRRGNLAIDATFSEFGEYQQQFYAAIQAGWYQEIDFFQPIDTATRVHVRFRIMADGTVDQVEAVHSTASKLATMICVTAITKRSPFRPWTVEMVRVFGNERVLNVVFHYR